MSEFNTSIVAFMAHPDDAELSVAGTLRLLAARGWKITIVAVTSGGMGGIGSTEAGTVARRMGEAAKASAMLGAEFRCLGGRDGFLYDCEELRLAAVELIREKEAGVVLAHLPTDYHADHRAASVIAETASLLSTLPNVPSRSAPLPRTPLLYHSAPLGRTDAMGDPVSPPGFFVDIESVSDFKRSMLACHESQAEVMRVMHGMDDFFASMRAQDEGWGALAGLALAEAFWPHLGGGFSKEPLLQEELRGFVKPGKPR